MKDCIEVNHLNDSNIINKDEIQQLIEWLPKTPQKILKLYDTTEDAQIVVHFIKNVIIKEILLFL